MSLPESSIKSVIGIGGLDVRRGDGVIVTFALGSCLGIVVYDNSTRIGGMVHVQLPSAARSPELAKQKPGLFVDTGLPLLIDQVVRAGANKRLLRLVVAGGSSIASKPGDLFNIAHQNLTALRKQLWKSGMMMSAEDTGGSDPRNLELDVATGVITVSALGARRTL